MILKRFIVPAPAFLAVSLFAAAPAAAISVDRIDHTIDLSFTDAAGARVASDFASVQSAPGADVTAPIAAFIGGGGFRMAAAVTETGIFGVEAETFAQGVLAGSIQIAERLVNDAGVAQSVSATFIVNEGFASLVGNEDSRVRYSVEVGEFPFTEFESVGELAGQPDFSAVFTETGDSLGAEQPVPGGAVGIPFSVQTVELGVFQPGEEFDFFYDLVFEIGGGVTELARFEFVDPLLPQGSRFVTFDATPVGVAAVPAPPALLLLASGIALMGAAGACRVRMGAASMG